MTVDQRRASLLDHIGTHGRASVAELSELFGVSAVTVRGDLQSLADSRLLRRVHGGAVWPADPAVPESPPPAPAGPGPAPTGPAPARPVPTRPVAVTAREGRSVGAAAAELVSSGDALLVDGGPVATWLVRAILRRRDLQDLTFCTNDLDVAIELRRAVPRFTVLVAGGTLRASGSTLAEPLIGPALDRIRADLCFLGCVGVSRAAGVTGADFEHGAVWQRYLHGSERSVLVATGASVGAGGQVALAGIEELDLLVTAASADPTELSGLRDAGLDVRTVD
jgi:DeoR family transcriptional regulator of aga operon